MAIGTACELLAVDFLVPLEGTADDGDAATEVVDVVSAPVPVTDVLEGALLVGLPHVKRAVTERAPERTFDGDGHAGGLLAVDGLDHHAPVATVGGGESDIAARGEVSRGVLEIAPAGLCELRGVGGGPDGSLDVVVAGPVCSRTSGRSWARRGCHSKR